MKQLLHKIARYFLPVLFISYIGCISLFTHSHVVNGVTIVHSHPYKPGTEHGHTTAEFQLIHMLSSIETENPSMWTFVSVILFSYCSRLFSRPDISVSFPRNGALMVCELRPFRFCNMIYLGEKSCCPYLISR